MRVEEAMALQQDFGDGARVKISLHPGTPEEFVVAVRRLCELGLQGPCCCAASGSTAWLEFEDGLRFITVFVPEVPCQS